MECDVTLYVLPTWLNCEPAVLTIEGRCSACDAALSNWYFEKDGLLFCKDDYWAKYGESCQDCGHIITGPVMVAGDHKFHPECFCCTSCGNFIDLEQNQTSASDNSEKKRNFVASILTQSRSYPSTLWMSNTTLLVKGMTTITSLKLKLHTSLEDVVDQRLLLLGTCTLLTSQRYRVLAQNMRHVVLFPATEAELGACGCCQMTRPTFLKS
uniref:LIM zinc-binding domain-containing protein n=1 Tax=Timema douglasi TaxID=61478 RepID=A0A7R8VNU6_TIMDO|nr:unnamed protein product [Timema douglasi]